MADADDNLPVVTTRPDAPKVQPFPENVDVLVLPGFPDREVALNEAGNPYPSTTIDVVKRLRQLGLTVEFTESREQRLEVALKASELWIPVLQVAQQVFINLGVWQLIKAFELRSTARSASAGEDIAGESDRAEAPLLHVRMAVVREDGRETRWIEVDGSPDDVVRVIAQVQEELRE